MDVSDYDNNTQYMENVILDRQLFLQILNENEGIAVFKFGAEWCTPCNRIKNIIDSWSRKLPSTAKLYMVDVDDSFDLYAHLKTRKIVPAIPAILAYYKGNVSVVPDKVVLGAVTEQINQFFENL